MQNDMLQFMSSTPEININMLLFGVCAENAVMPVPQAKHQQRVQTGNASLDLNRRIGMTYGDIYLKGGEKRGRF